MNQKIKNLVEFVVDLLSIFDYVSIGYSWKFEIRGLYNYKKLSVDKLENPWFWNKSNFGLFLDQKIGKLRNRA